MSKHRLFISWSGQQAGIIAPALKTFLQDVLGIDGIFLSKEIDSGRRWSSEIADALETCDAGVIVVTSENKDAPWLNFEAGAISKNIDDSNVIPILWDVSVGDIASTPLNQFQCKSFSRTDIEFIADNLTELWSLQKDSIARRFQAMWPELEKHLESVPTQTSSANQPPTIEDVFSLVQRLGSRLSDIEALVESIESEVSYGIYGQSELATASPAEAAKLLAPYLRSAQVHGSQRKGSGLFGSNVVAKNALASLIERGDAEPAEVNSLLSALKEEGESMHRPKKEPPEEPVF